MKTLYLAVLAAAIGGGSATLTLAADPSTTGKAPSAPDTGRNVAIVKDAHQRGSVGVEG